MPRPATYLVARRLPQWEILYVSEPGESKAALQAAARNLPCEVFSLTEARRTPALRALLSTYTGPVGDPGPDTFPPTWHAKQRRVTVRVQALLRDQLGLRFISAPDLPLWRAISSRTW